jgi:ubiquinone/menaquinone biosynthesis C-methylase UbiE
VGKSISRTREFDEYAASYEELLRDPLRGVFSAEQPELFHRRKRDFLLRSFARRKMATAGWSYLDVGCGRGELLGLMASEFAEAVGCDPSSQMLHHAQETAKIVFQKDALQLPFADARFDFVTAVCVFHHVPLRDRPLLIADIRRVLKPGGTFCLIEHNPLNPVTRTIVKRSPVDVDVHLLSHREAKRLLEYEGLQVEEASFFLYLPEFLYKWWPGLEGALRRVPLGGQYAVFGRR